MNTPPALSHFDDSLADAFEADPAVNGSAVPTPRPLDPLESANAARVRAGERLDQLTWTFPDGSRKVPLLTSSRWALYEALRGKIGADDVAEILTESQAQAQSLRRRYIECGILLFLCLNSPQTWEQPRTIARGDRHFQIEPLMANFGDFMAAIRVWVDAAIPPHQWPEAVRVCDALTSATFAAVTVARPDGDDDDSEEGSEKKTPSPDGMTDTSPSSAPPSV